MTGINPTLPAHPAAEVFPLMGGDELQELAADIKARGLLEPVWLHEDPELGRVVLDGRNRIAACAIAGATPATRLYQGDDPVSFAISANLKRRHLTTGQKAAVAAEVEPLYADQARLRQLSSLRQNAGRTVRADLPERSRDQAAKTAGTSGRAVAQFKRIKDKAPELADRVKSGDMALDRADRLLRDKEAENKRVEQARLDAAAAEISLTADVRLGDFREVLTDIPDGSIDAIITDPPYPREFLPLLADLAVFADRVLKPDGVLAVLFGQTYLPDVYRLLDGGRPYRWTACYYTPGPAYSPHGDRIRVQSNWKPLIIYGAGPRFSDVITSTGNGGKQHHKWGQNFDAFHTIIERLTTGGQTVCDPFMGAGTTLLAAHALRRNVIGCDIEAEHVQTARERLA